MANSEDPVPPVWKERVLSYSTGLTFDAATKRIDAAMTEAEKQELTLVAKRGNDVR